MLTYRDTEFQKKAKETTAELKQLFLTFDSYRSQWDDRAIEWYKKLVGYKDDEDDDDNRANFHIPRTYQIVDTIRSRILMALFKERPYIEFIPTPSEQKRFSMQQAEEKAKVGSALIDGQLEKNNIVAKFYDYLTSLLVFPKGVLGVGWRYEEDYVKKKVPIPEIIKTPYGNQYTGNFNYQMRESRETTWDDNEIVHVDYFDFWPDPHGSNLDDCRGVFQREFVTEEELLQRLNFLDYLEEGIIYLESRDELEELRGSSGLERGREERLAAIGLTDEMPQVFRNSQDERLNKNAEHEILHYWEDNRHAMLVDRQKVVYDGPSPYWRHRKKPFVVASYDRLPNEFYGLSAVQLINDLQEEENTIHNQRTDNVNFVLNKMWKVRRGADIDESELVSRPHGVIHVDRAEDVQPFEMNDVAASSFQQHNMVSQVMENTLATPPVVRGAESSGDKTATETRGQMGNASTRFDVKIQLFRSMSIKRLAYLMDMNNQQFINEDRLVNLGTQESAKWRTINPGELIGEFDYRPAGANVDPAANKQQRREQLTQMMQFLLQAGVPFVDYHELIKEWVKSFDFENAEKFIIPQDKWEAQQQQQMMMAQQAQQENGNSSNRPTQAEQSENAQTGRARGRRPQTERNPTEQSSGVIR